MDDDEFIMIIILSCMIVSFILHIIFFITRTFDRKCRYVKQTNEKDKEILSCSSLTSDDILERRTIHSFSLLLCTCLFITNWLRLGLVYVLPKFYPSLSQSSSNLCIVQSFFLHVLTLFHLHLTICLRLFWYYCFVVKKYWQTVTYRRILMILVFVFICLCLFTLPSISNEWASIVFDRLLQICIVNYTFKYSYTFFVLIFTCLIPFILLIICHRRQMKSMENRISKYISINQNLSEQKIRFQYSSYIILIWSFLNILLLICLHIPLKHKQIRIILYYTQLISFLFDPVLYIFIFRSISLITLLRPTNGIYFI